MRIARFNIVTEPISRARTGAVVADGVIGDLRAGYAKYLIEHEGDPQGCEIAALRIPPDVRHILHVGKHARSALEQTATWLAALHASDPGASGVDGEPLFTPADKARLHNPLKPARIIVVHGGTAGAAPAVREWAASTAMGPVRDLPLPAHVEALTPGAGLAIVIGKACRSIAERDAPGCIAGYMVANAVEAPAHDGVTTYRRCIIGPHLVTTDDVPDVGKLRVAARVNGSERQSGSTADTRWPIARLVSMLSAHGLEPGDVIVTCIAGPGGTSTAPLRAGDVLETEIDGLGIMRNKVVAESGGA